MLRSQNNVDMESEVTVAKKKRTLTVYRGANPVVVSCFTSKAPRKRGFAKEEPSKPWFFTHI